MPTSHSIRDRPSIYRSDNSKLYISPGDLPPINALGTPIRLPNQWSLSGYGTHYLARTELGTAFDLPSWVIPTTRQMNKSFFDTLHPVQALLSISDVLLPFDAARGNVFGISTLEVLAYTSLDPRGTWLSQQYWKKINGKLTQLIAGFGWLPLAWIDKAVKADKTSVPVHIWNQRICLLPMGITKSTRFASIIIFRNSFYNLLCMGRSARKLRSMLKMLVVYVWDCSCSVLIQHQTTVVASSQQLVVGTVGSYGNDSIAGMNHLLREISAFWYAITVRPCVIRCYENESNESIDRGNE